MDALARRLICYFPRRHSKPRLIFWHWQVGWAATAGLDSVVEIYRFFVRTLNHVWFKPGRLFNERELISSPTSQPAATNRLLSASRARPPRTSTFSRNSGINFLTDPILLFLMSQPAASGHKTQLSSFRPTHSSGDNQKHRFLVPTIPPFLNSISSGNHQVPLQPILFVSLSSCW
jgi:hypothetical protein